MIIASVMTRNPLYVRPEMTVTEVRELMTKEKATEQALEYLKSRQINDETVKSMLLGYSGDWSGLINHLHKLGYTNEDIKQGFRGDHY